MSDDHDTSNDPLVFWTHAGKLTDLASVSVMASLMHRKIILIHRGNEEIKMNAAETDLIQAPLPETILKKFMSMSRPMNVSRAKWWKYHWEQVFFRNMPSDDMVTLFDQLVWLHDGSISFEQTARKLMSSDKLTNVQKFQIACTYFFIDEVNSLKESLSPDEMHLATESFCTDVDPFLEYWHCKIRHMKPYMFWATVQIDFFAQLTVPLCRKYYVHWPVVEYFWNQLPNETERLRNVKRIIDQRIFGSPELMWHLLPKLSSSELDSILKQDGHRIVVNFARDPNYVEYTILIWKRVVNSIDNESLNSLLSFLTELFENQSYVDGLLWQMWFYMSEQQKKFIADQQEFDYASKWIEDREYSSLNYQLIIDVFSLWDPERRFRYWTANWPRFVIGRMNHKDKIEELMRLSLGSDENIAVFKRTVMTDHNSLVQRVFEDLLSEGLFDESLSYLNFCTEDPDVIRNLKKQIIVSMSNDYLLWFVCDCCLDQRIETGFNNFMHNIFTTDEIEDLVRNSFMSSPETVRKMIHEECVTGLIQCVDKYISNEKDVDKIKLDCIKYCYELKDAERLIEGDGVVIWVELLSWCFDGNKSLTERFKLLLQSAKVPDNVEMRTSDERRAPDSHLIYESYCNLFLKNE